MSAKRFSPRFPGRFQRSLMPLTFMILAGMSAIGFSGCGYSIRSARSDALEKEGIRRVYVSPIVNNTYHYGVENVVYNALIRSLASFGGLKLVGDPAEADAVLSGTVSQADSLVDATTRVSDLNPLNLAPPSRFGSIYVASTYSAVLTCSFSLIRRNPGPKKASTVWSGGFTRSKPYPASNQVGALGTTSPLINDSEFDRTLLDIAQNMMLDVREAIVARF